MKPSPAPLVIDLFCGSFGWSRGFIAEGWRSVGFDIEHKPHHGPVPEGCELVLQDVATLQGSQLKQARVIVASPPCQRYSWLAMPWSRSRNEKNSMPAKMLRAQWETEGPDNSLFAHCLRLQAEAVKAAGHHIPLIIENVRGAQEWLGAALIGLEEWMAASRRERWDMGRADWCYGSYYLWGDVPALMPVLPYGGLKRPGRNFHGQERGLKSSASFNGADHETRGVKVGGDWFRDPKCHSRFGSKSPSRKAASAAVATIPFELSAHLARVFR